MCRNTSAVFSSSPLALVDDKPDLWGDGRISLVLPGPDAVKVIGLWQQCRCTRVCPSEASEFPLLVFIGLLLWSPLCEALHGHPG